MNEPIHVNEITGKLPNIVFNEDEDGAIHCDLSGIAQNIITCDKETKMSEIVREMTREELVSLNNKLREENEKLREELHDARFAAEHNDNLLQQERLRHELYRKDGEISGLRFALRCITEGCRTKAILDWGSGNLYCADGERREE